MAETREFTRNTKILIIGEFINFILLMAFNLFLIRFLSVAEYSYFNRILVFPMILAYVTDLGLFYGCVYYVARFSKTNQNHKTRNIMKITLITKSLIGLILSLVVFFLSQSIISPLLGIQLQPIIEIVQFASLLLFAKNLFEAVLAILQGLMKMEVLISLKNIQIALQFIVTLFFVFFDITLYGAIIALVISTFCVGLLGVLYLYKKRLTHKRRKEKIEWTSTSLIIKRGFFIH